MAPKPFPYPLGVGIDICHSQRLHKVLSLPGEGATRWARKVFNRQEWPYIWQKCHQASGQRIPPENSKASLWIPQFISTGEVRGRGHPATSHFKGLSNLLQPNTAQIKALSQYKWQSTRASCNADLAADTPSRSNDPPSPLAVSPQELRLLSQYLAGRFVYLLLYQVCTTANRLYRWAAKEATVKAHRHRKLYLRDISILSPESFSERPTNTVKVQALVAPKSTTRILMDAEVAKLRGLFGKQSRFGNYYGSFVEGQIVGDYQPNGGSPPGNPPKPKYFVRETRIKDEEQQIAELSISHDGEYAVAVCMALDEPLDRKEAIEFVFDDGSGEPLHEPEWGDRGWLENDELLSKEQ
ncbi:MAG: hypothetical protein LQ338_000279 [Usnochroma carphineum]|nr:MAG: hypothetical protein LQ338_000279 [Usnochroma carphineum]